MLTPGQMRALGTSSGSGGVTINIINNAGAEVSQSSRKTSNGMEVDVVLDKMVAGKLTKRGSSSNKAITPGLQRPAGDGKPVMAMKKMDRKTKKNALPPPLIAYMGNRCHWRNKKGQWVPFDVIPDVGVQKILTRLRDEGPLSYFLIVRDICRARGMFEIAPKEMTSELIQGNTERLQSDWSSLEV